MIELQDQPNKCEHCGRKFVNSKTLFNHMCEQKRRILQETEKRVQIGFMVFNRYYELSHKNIQPKTYVDFCQSPYYNAFVKFGSYINNVNPVHPDKFVDYIIKSGEKLDNWCSDKLYETYLFDIIKKEPVDSAIKRSLKTMLDWGEKQNANFAHYFNYVNLNRATNDILNGQISPWIVLNCKSGKHMISKMNDEQLTIISPILDVKFWMKRFKENPADVLLINEICKETGIS